MKNSLVVSIALVALITAAIGLYAAAPETFTGTAARTGTHKRPLLVVNGKGYELKASAKADAKVAEMLEKFSRGDTGTYTVKGVRGAVNGGDGIIVESVTPAKATSGGGSAAPKSSKSSKHKVYDHAVKDHKFRLVVPEGLKVVRGILVVGPCIGGDSRDYHKQPWYGELLNLHGFAFLGAKDYYMTDYKVLQAALKRFAADAKHPELVNAPFAATGLSAGGGFARRLVKEVPDKVIAAVIVCSTLKSTHFTPAAVHRTVPVCVITGELEGGDGLAGRLEPALAEHRPKDALWGWTAAQGVGHEFAGQEVLAMPILDVAVRMRYPKDGDVTKGPVKLLPVDHKTGWVADNRSWKSGITTIAAAKEFKGNVAKSSWLLNQDMAFVYRAYSTFDRPLKITSPDPMSAQSEAFDAGSSVTITVDDSKFKGWKKLELYDGAKKVGELTKGKARFTVKGLKAGYHAFSVLGTDAKGNVRPSNPALVVVRK